MRKFILFVFLFIGFFPVCNLQAKELYVMSKHTEGFLFFIYPQKVPAGKDALAKKDLRLDFTYLTSKDSITLTATYTASQLFPASEVTLLIPDKGRYSFPVEVIYRDKKKNKWRHRVRFTIPYTLFEEAYQSPDPYQTSFTDEGRSLRYSYSRGSWNRIKAKMMEIIQAIRLNKE